MNKICHIIIVKIKIVAWWNFRIQTQISFDIENVSHTFDDVVCCHKYSTIFELIETMILMKLTIPCSHHEQWSDGFLYKLITRFFHLIVKSCKTRPLLN